MTINLSEIRNIFINYFEKNNHKHVKSSSLIPHNDPSLLFTNSGMVQFKNYFLGIEEPEFKKVTTYQKCLRAGGKHNDLDNVGYTARHHTFFEMLGNFSFGDYFKEEAIYYAWDLITNHFKLDKNRLYLTVYHTDEEAFNIWKKVTSFPDHKIIKIDTKDNFWSMGDTGPCGPCSEIFYDQGEHIFGGLPGTKDQDGDRFIEIWNLVFMQYETLKDGSMRELPKKAIDTGMGIERVSSVLQGKDNNFETDHFRKIINYISKITNVEINQKNIANFRIIADHLRAACFLIADGVFPSNEGRGYVLRRILRRAMKNSHKLNISKPVIYQFVEILTEEMGKVYPELVNMKNLVTELIRQEEEKFIYLLDRGIKLLDGELEKIENNKLSGQVAFKLYDTYGFPLDLTKDILREKQIDIDEESFNEEMKKQKEMARKAWSGSGEKQEKALWFDLKEKYGSSEFVGYSHNNCSATILSIIQQDQETKEAGLNNEVAVIVNQTPFYGESGGQVGDSGLITTESGKIVIKDTKKFAENLIVHFGLVTEGIVKVNQEAKLTIDQVKRNKVKANHTATHLLHAALRKILGTHVSQKGSLVADNYLRFDFSHTKPMSLEELNAVEEAVNQVVVNNLTLETKILPTEQAIEQGAMALFGEKYADESRVIFIQEEEDHVSVELCGGTHVNRTGDIGFFKIISESSIASSVRRIEAVTGMEAVKYAKNQENIVLELQQTFKTKPNEICTRVSQLMEEVKEKQKQIENYKLKIADLTLDQEIKEINGLKVGINIYNELDAKFMRDFANKEKNKLDLVILLAVNEDKLAICSSIFKEQQLSALDLVKFITELAGGKGGGGKNDFAQSGAAKPSDMKLFKKQIFEFIEKKL